MTWSAPLAALATRWVKRDGSFGLVDNASGVLQTDSDGVDDEAVQ